MVIEKARIIRNEHVGSSYFKIGLECGDNFLSAIPGQFVMLKIDGINQPLLRRPFSIHKIIRGKGIEILYRVVGECTGKLAETKAGGSVDIMGPLGKGFPLFIKPGVIFIVGGGVGAAPMPFLSEYVLRNRKVSSSDIKVFLGARSKNDILCREDFLKMELETVVTTDDGSEGDACLVTDPVEAAMKGKRPGVIYACGPFGMLKCLAGMAERYKIPCYLSVESIMACGIGACLGCAVPGKDGGKYLHVCMDGPVFDSRELRL
jgi:dihydroorotate dehydrogenase electron transfer subunit